MKLINLDHCSNENHDLVKKSSLFLFLKNNNDFDKEKLKASLGIDGKTLDDWISEFKSQETKITSKEMFLSMVSAGIEMNYAKTARELGVDRVTLYNWKKKLN